MPSKVDLGMRGQQEAEAYLTAKGCRVLERNYRAKTGEIDLIIQDGNYIAFVEVKYRNGLAYGLPGEAVTFAKQRHIKRTALHYIAVRQLTQQDFRFDVVEILNENGKHHIEHIENAFI